MSWGLPRAQGTQFVGKLGTQIKSVMGDECPYFSIGHSKPCLGPRCFVGQKLLEVLGYEEEKYLEFKFWRDIDEKIMEKRLRPFINGNQQSLSTTIRCFFTPSNSSNIYKHTYSSLSHDSDLKHCTL